MAQFASDRLASLLQRELASIINNNIVDETIGYINIVAVKVTKDLSIATIYYTIFNTDEKVLEKLDNLFLKYKGNIKKELSSKIRNAVRKIPELRYEFDKALAYGNHIDKILKSLK